MGDSVRDVLDFKYLAYIRGSEMPDLNQVRQDVHWIRAGESILSEVVDLNQVRQCFARDLRSNMIDLDLVRQYLHRLGGFGSGCGIAFAVHVD